MHRNSSLPKTVSAEQSDGFQDSTVGLGAQLPSGLARKNQCAVISRWSPVGETKDPTREVTLHPEPPQGVTEVTKSLEHLRKRAVKAAQGAHRP